MNLEEQTEIAVRIFVGQLKKEGLTLDDWILWEIPCFDRKYFYAYFMNDQLNCSICMLVKFKFESCVHELFFGVSGSGREEYRTISEAINQPQLEDAIDLPVNWKNDFSEYVKKFAEIEKDFKEVLRGKTSD